MLRILSCLCLLHAYVLAETLKPIQTEITDMAFLDDPDEPFGGFVPSNGKFSSSACCSECSRVISILFYEHDYCKSTHSNNRFGSDMFGELLFCGAQSPSLGMEESSANSYNHTCRRIPYREQSHQFHVDIDFVFLAERHKHLRAAYDELGRNKGGRDYDGSGQAIRWLQRHICSDCHIS